MEQLDWIDACAMRLTELARMTPESADRIATRMWHTKVPVCYRNEPPGLAAESWYGGATCTPAEREAAAPAFAADDAATMAPACAEASLEASAVLDAARTAWAVALQAVQARLDCAYKGEPQDLALLGELNDAADAAKRRYRQSRRASIA